MEYPKQMFEHQLSIMTENNFRANKGKVSVRKDGKYIKACFPRNYCSGKQIKLATGIPLNNDWANQAEKLQIRLQLALEDGKLDDGFGNFNEDYYDEILADLGLKARLKLVKSPEATVPTYKLPEPSLIDIWDNYSDYRGNKDLAETTYKIIYKGSYRNYLMSAIAEVGNHPEKVRLWLLQNRAHNITKRLLPCLRKAYDFAIAKKMYFSTNPLLDNLDEHARKGKQGYVSDSQSEDKEEVTTANLGNAYSWAEAEIIMEYVKNNDNISHWYNFIKFKFLTGTRTGEAVALWWKDVRWDDEIIIIRRTYNRRIRKNLDTKNESIRFFPMPKDGELWNLLKSITPGLPNENVFKSKQGKIIIDSSIRRVWSGCLQDRCPGIVLTLFKQGKISKVLPAYNTRHTFITHQIYDMQIQPAIVSAWCEHSESVSQKHYQDVQSYSSKVIPGYGNKPEEVTANSELELLRKQMAQMQKRMEQLTTTSSK